MMRNALFAIAAVWVVSAQATTWGGDHIEMEVTSKNARIEFDCAHGTIDRAPRADATGAFKISGTFTPERSGPVATEEGPRTVKATYEGSIDGDVMTLRVVLEGEERQANAYTLTRDQRGNVRKCK